jgi:hypothetical protein
MRSFLLLTLDDVTSPIVPNTPPKIVAKANVAMLENESYDEAMKLLRKELQDDSENAEWFY